MSQQQSDFNQRWVQHQRSRQKTTLTYGCVYCRKIFLSFDEVWAHALTSHQKKLPIEEHENALRELQVKFEADCLQRRSRNDTQTRKSSPSNESTGPQPEPQLSQTKRPLASPGATPRSLSDLQGLNIDASRQSEDVEIQDVSDNISKDRLRKIAAVGDGISAGSGSPFRDKSDSPLRRKAPPILTPSVEAETMLSDIEVGGKIGHYDRDPRLVELMHNLQRISRLQRQVIEAQIKVRQKRREVQFSRNHVFLSDGKFMKGIERLLAKSESLKGSNELVRLAEKCQEARDNLGPLEDEALGLDNENLQSEFRRCLASPRDPQDSLGNLNAGTPTEAERIVNGYVSEVRQGDQRGAVCARISTGSGSQNREVPDSPRSFHEILSPESGPPQSYAPVHRSHTLGIYSPSPTTPRSPKLSTHDLSNLPDEPILHPLKPDNHSHHIQPPPRFPQNTHPGIDGSNQPTFVPANHRIRYYHTSASTFLDLVDDALLSDWSGTQKLRIRCGSRKLGPTRLDKSACSQKHLYNVTTHLEETSCKLPIRYWPPAQQYSPPMLYTLLSISQDTSKLPLPSKDETRSFAKDLAIRMLSWIGCRNQSSPISKFSDDPLCGILSLFSFCKVLLEFANKRLKIILGLISNKGVLAGLLTKLLLIPVVDGRPVNYVHLEKQDGFVPYWEEFGTDLVSRRFAPFLKVTGVVVIGFGAFSGILNLDKRWKGSHILFFSMSSFAIGTPYVGMEAQVSNGYLTPLWCFTAAQMIAYMSRRLAPYPKTAGATALIISTLGVVSSAAITYSCHPTEGRYSNHAVHGIFLALPATLFFIWTWIAVFLKFRLAQWFEMRISDCSDTPATHIAPLQRRIEDRDARMHLE